MAGAIVVYGLGGQVGEARLRRSVGRHGRWLALDGGDIDRANEWFRRKGRWAVRRGRLAPGMRSFALGTQGTLVSDWVGRAGWVVWAFLLAALAALVVGRWRRRRRA